LLLDEATSALDALTEAQVQQSLDSLDCTRIVIAHRLSTIRKANLILVVEKGQVIESGDHETLVAMGGFYAQLVATQMGGETQGQGEGYEEGQGEGYEEGQGEGYEEGQGEGYEEGQDQGYREGQEQGQFQGQDEGQDQGASAGGEAEAPPVGESDAPASAAAVEGSSHEPVAPPHPMAAVTGGFAAPPPPVKDHAKILPGANRAGSVLSSVQRAKLTGFRPTQKPGPDSDPNE